jgi:membrane associated rhomboid family serine protease
MWNDFKLKYLKSGNPALLYIALSIAAFVAIILVKVGFVFANKRGLVDGLVDDYLAFHSSPSLWPTHFYTLLTYQFVHADFLHLLVNMLVLYWIGQLLLDFIKPRQFHLIYLTGGICGALFFALIYNLIPAFQPAHGDALLVGASAAVMAVFSALVTLVPDYNLRLMLLGNIKIKYLLLIYVLLDLIGITSSTNAGGSLSHLGGVLFGFAYIKMLKNGSDISLIFRKKPKLKVVKNENQKNTSTTFNQKEIDTILDKISKFGYDKLSKDEKEILFRASKN